MSFLQTRITNHGGKSSFTFKLFLYIHPTKQGLNQFQPKILVRKFQGNVMPIKIVEKYFHSSSSVSSFEPIEYGRKGIMSPTGFSYATLKQFVAGK